jgi:hypothetical protein
MFIVHAYLGRVGFVGKSQYALRNPALSECGGLPVTGVVGCWPSAVMFVAQMGHPMLQHASESSKIESDVVGWLVSVAW